jgi:hypothetical protein
MSKWKDEDIATAAFIQEYLQEFREGIFSNPACAVDEKEKPKIEAALTATDKFCSGLLTGKKKLYMHDLILMAIGFYGGYLTALDAQK